MLITNLTSHTYVLGRGVVLHPDAADVEVADATYQADTLLNQQIDNMEREGLISITGKPSDTFPAPVASDVDGQVVLTASASDKTPLTVVGANGQTSDLFIVSTVNAPLLEVRPREVSITAQKTADGSSATSVRVSESGVAVDALPEAVPLRIYAAGGQTADLLEVYDEDGNLVFSVTADGRIHAKASFASLVVPSTGANNDLTFTAKAAGADGDALQIKLHASTVLQIDDNSAGVFTINYDEGVTTAAAVVAACAAHGTLDALIAVTAEGSGAGLVTANGTWQNLADGGVIFDL